MQPNAAAPRQAWLPTDPRRLARTAGALYLAVILLGLGAEVGIRAALVVPGDPSATAANLLAAEGRFRLAVAADALMAMADVALAVLLFLLLRPVSPALALLATVFRLVQAAILGMNVLNQHAALLLLADGAAPGLSPATTEALAALAIARHAVGYDIGLLFFAVNSLLTGWLLIRSGFLPAALGVLLVAAGLVYLVGSALVLLAPAAAAAFQPAYGLCVLAEAAFCLWLLLRGVDAERWLAAAGGWHPGPALARPDPG